MKVYSKVITRADLYRTLIDIDDVLVDDSGIREFVARDGTPAFELYLEGYGARHRRARNQRGGKAASWDDYGLWFAQLFKLDPAARISFYNGVGDFLDSTAWYIPRGQSAPWLHEPIYFELSKLAAREFERVRAEERLKELRIELRAERISYGELIELQGLVKYIDPSDVELLEAAGVPEHATV